MKIDELILSIAQRQLDIEEASFMDSQKNVVEIVRRGYDKWIELFSVLKAKKVGCYQYMVELLAGPDFNITTNVDAVRKAFGKVREERGLKSASNAFSSTQGLRYSNTGVVPGRAVQLERRAPVSPSQGVRVAPTATAPVEAIAQQGEGIQSGGFGGVSWSLGANTAIFNGLEIAYYGPPLGVSLERLRVPFSKVVGGRQRGEVVEALRFYVGFMEKIGRAGIREPGLGEEEQLVKYAASGWSDSAVALLQSLQDAL